MAQLLKVDEWQSGSGKWRVADVHTWTNWEVMADVLGAQSLDEFMELLTNKYGATIEFFREYEEWQSLLEFSFEQYKGAHQLKLDVNRIARKKNYMVENTHEQKL